MSTRATPESLRTAAEIQEAIARATIELRAARRKLMHALRAHARLQSPLIDDEPAIVEGEPVDLVEWLRSRVEDVCLRGSLAEAIEDLELESESDALARLADYVRAYRLFGGGSP